MRRERLAIFVFLTFVFASSCAFAGELATHAFDHNGYSRPYLVYTPDPVSLHAPVVFVLGGVGSTAKSTADDLGWMRESDMKGFLVVFPEPLATDPTRPLVKRTNPTFWEMHGSRTHVLAPGAKAVDDDGYLMAVLAEVVRGGRADRKRVFFTGFSSGSGMVQLLASRHPRSIAGIAAVATPLMEPPPSLAVPVPVLYIHGDDDEQFSGFEVNSPDFATTPHGNWVTWGYLNGCHLQTAKKTDWGVRLTWQRCKRGVPVVADFVKGLGHEYLSNDAAPWMHERTPHTALNFPDMTWTFFSMLPHP